MVLCTGQSDKHIRSPIPLFHMMTDPGYQFSSFVFPLGIRAWYTLEKVLQLLNELCVIIFQLLFQTINTWYLLRMYQIVDKPLTLSRVPSTFSITQGIEALHLILLKPAISQEQLLSNPILDSNIKCSALVEIGIPTWIQPWKQRK
jgi:hypothetical protein